MSDELPQGWASVPLDEIAEINPRHPKNLDGHMPVTFVPMAGISEAKPEFQYTEERPLGDVRKGFTHFAERDVLFAKITPCMENGKGAVARGLRNKLGCGTTELHVIRPLADISPDYIYRFLAQRSIRHAAKENFTGTAGQARVPTTFIEKLEIPLAPLAEQRRIVPKLEKLLSQVDTCQERLAKIPALLKRFRQAVLSAACSGRLTADWREEKGVSTEESWRDAELRDICSSITDGDHLPPPKRATGIPFLTIGNISSGRLDFSETRFVPESYFASIKPDRIPKRGDTLYTVVGASIGIPVLVDTDRAFCFQRHVAILKPSKETASKFLHALMGSPAVFREAWARITGTAQPTLPLGNLRSIPISIPSLPEQEEIVRRVEKLFALSDRLEARFAAGRKRVGSITQAILAKAFRGELVPTEFELAKAEGRSFESAEVLLKRIKGNGQIIQAETKPSRKK
jgi:type I restriction enzyme S subunit